jgi:hypothetical protein
MFSLIKPNQFQNFVMDFDKSIMETYDHFDVLIRDFDETKISRDIALLLDVPYLSKARWPPSFPVIGKLTNTFLSND